MGPRRGPYWVDKIPRSQYSRVYRGLGAKKMFKKWFVLFRLIYFDLLASRSPVLRSRAQSPPTPDAKNGSRLFLFSIGLDICGHPR